MRLGRGGKRISSVVAYWPERINSDIAVSRKTARGLENRLTPLLGFAVGEE